MWSASASSYHGRSFDKFTARAHQALAGAQEEASARNHDRLGTEHVLLGVLGVEDGAAVLALQRLHVSPDDLREHIITIIGTRDRPPVAGEIGVTPRTKQVLALAVDEAKRLHQDRVDVGHVLLALARDRDGIAGHVLRERHVELGALRRAVGAVASPPQEESGDGPTAAGGVTRGEARALAEDLAVPESAPSAGTKSNVVTCRLDNVTLDALDTLVAAGIRPTRSDAAAWLIGIGLETNRPLLERVSATVAEIRRLRLEAQSLATKLPDEDLPT
jgi:ATP-dependent Clp protease ATP-binding subunit ClpA